jgi:hypothetical protein
MARKLRLQKLLTIGLSVNVLFEIMPPGLELVPVGNINLKAVPVADSTLAFIILTGISGREL